MPDENNTAPRPPSDTQRQPLNIEVIDTGPSMDRKPITKENKAAANKFATKLQDLAWEAASEKDKERLKKLGLKKITMEEMKRKERIRIIAIASAVVLLIAGYLLLSSFRSTEKKETRIGVDFSGVNIFIPYPPREVNNIDKEYSYRADLYPDSKALLNFDNSTGLENTLSTLWGTHIYYKVMEDLSPVFNGDVGIRQLEVYRKEFEKAGRNLLKQEDLNYRIWLNQDPGFFYSAHAALIVNNRLILLEAITNNENLHEQMLADVSEWSQLVLNANPNVKVAENQ